MSNQDEAIEALAVELREREMERQRLRGDTIQSADTPRTIAADVLASDWLDGYVRRHRAEALREASRDIPAQVAIEPYMRNRINGWLNRRADQVEADDD